MTKAIWICAMLTTVVSGKICEKTNCELESECDCSGGSYDKLGFAEVDILRFTDNELKSFDIFNRTRVKSQLKLNNNQIRSLDNIPETLHGLHLLYLVHNEITHIAANTFSKFKQLRDLRLNHNKISVIDENVFNGAMCLSTLNLSYNNIQTITFVNHLPKVVSLTLSHNVISDLSPIENANLTKLSVLYLNDNKILSFSINIFRNMPNLENVHLENNKKSDEDKIEMRELKVSVNNQRKLTVDLNSFTICCKIEEIIGYDKTCHNCSELLTPKDTWFSIYKYHIISAVGVIVILLGIATYFVCNLVFTTRDVEVYQGQNIQEKEGICKKNLQSEKNPESCEKNLQLEKQPEEDHDGYLTPKDLKEPIYEEIEERYSAVSVNIVS